MKKEDEERRGGDNGYRGGKFSYMNEATQDEIAAQVASKLTEQLGLE